MKRVVIVTWTGVYNYGTCLQSYALQNVLERLGYHVMILDKLCFEHPLKTILNKCVKRLHTLKKRNYAKIARMDKFHKEEQYIIRPRNMKQLKSLIKKTDVFISGSDQIWNTAYKYTPMMFLDFADNKKRISYATSIGTADIPEEYKEIIKGHLQKYQHISVRETTAANVLKTITGRKDIIQVLDPTFLLTSDSWHMFGEKAEFRTELPDEYVFCYFVGDNNYYSQQVNDIIKRINLNHIVIATLKSTSSFSIEGAIVLNDAGPMEFVHLIEHSSLVCTDSFHATAIAINLRKPFIELLRFSDEDNASQNTRIYDLLAHYDLKERIYSNKHTQWMQPIDYNRVYEILHKDRIYSLNYLSSSIEN